MKHNSSVKDKNALIIGLLCCCLLIVSTGVISKPGLFVSRADSAGFSAYAPARVQAEFPFTTGITTQVIAESGGYYSYSVATTQPNASISYVLNSSDIYQVLLTITYPVPVSGEVYWSIGSLAIEPEYESMTFSNQTTVNTFIIVSAQTYTPVPTAQDIANARDSVLENAISNFSQAESAAYAQLQTNLGTILLPYGILTVAALSLSVFAAIRSVMKDRKNDKDTGDQI